MAVLGVQFVITMMMATILSRVGPHLSLARWLLCSRFAGLVRYLHPSDDQLRVHAPAPKIDKKEKKKQRHQMCCLTLIVESVVPAEVEAISTMGWRLQLRS